MELIEITDINASELDVFARATEPQLREEGLFLAETAYVIMRALEAGCKPVSMLVETDRVDAEAKPVLEEIEVRCGKDALDSLPVYTATRDVVTQITGHHLVRGLWMLMRRLPELTVDGFLEGKRRIAVMADVVNPANVGAIFRSAAALGMDGVLLTHTAVDPLTRRVARVSMGTVFQIPWARATLEESQGTALISRLQSFGYKTVAMALTEDSTNIDNEEIRANEKLAIVLGTEGTGLPSDVISACDCRVMIPMQRGVDSLNVAAASAISFWELMK